MRSLFHRLGLVGAILIASALIFGAIAGGVIVHRLQTTPTASSEQQQGDQVDEQKAGPSKRPSAPAKSNHADQGDQAGEQQGEQ